MAYLSLIICGKCHLANRFWPYWSGRLGCAWSCGSSSLLNLSHDIAAFSRLTDFLQRRLGRGGSCKIVKRKLSFVVDKTPFCQKLDFCLNFIKYLHCYIFNRLSESTTKDHCVYVRIK